MNYFLCYKMEIKNIKMSKSWNLLIVVTIYDAC